MSIIFGICAIGIGNRQIFGIGIGQSFRYRHIARKLDEIDLLVMGKGILL